MIRGIIFDKIDGQRSIGLSEKIPKIMGFQHNNRFTNVTSIQANAENNLPDLLRIDFIFTTTYTPPIASIMLTGYALFEPKDHDVGFFVSEWRKTNNLPPELAKELLNSIIPRCLQKATIISDQLNLPPPIPLPQPKSETGDEGGRPPQSQGLFV